MLNHWRTQPRNANKLSEPKISDDYLRAWVVKTGFKMKRERPLEQVSQEFILILPYIPL
jgi:hypothetical protein